MVGVVARRTGCDGGGPSLRRQLVRRNKGLRCGRRAAPGPGGRQPWLWPALRRRAPPAPGAWRPLYPRRGVPGAGPRPAMAGRGRRWRAAVLCSRWHPLSLPRLSRGGTRPVSARWGVRGGPCAPPQRDAGQASRSRIAAAVLTSTPYAARQTNSLIESLNRGRHPALWKQPFAANSPAERVIPPSRAASWRRAALA
jgi:hypothetical protein